MAVSMFANTSAQKPGASETGVGDGRGSAAAGSVSAVLGSGDVARSPGQGLDPDVLGWVWWRVARGAKWPAGRVVCKGDELAMDGGYMLIA